MEHIEISRRHRADLWTPAETAIYNAMQEIEKAGADIRLTHAQIKLTEAKNLVADYVDEQGSVAASNPKEQ